MQPASTNGSVNGTSSQKEYDTNIILCFPPRYGRPCTVCVLRNWEPDDGCGNVVLYDEYRNREVSTNLIFVFQVFLACIELQ